MRHARADGGRRDRGGQRGAVSTYVNLLGLDLEGKALHHALGRVTEDVVAEEAHGWRVVLERACCAVV